MGINAIILAEAPAPVTLAQAREWTRKLRRSVPMWLSPSRDSGGLSSPHDSPEALRYVDGLCVEHPVGAEDGYIVMYDATWESVSTSGNPEGRRGALHVPEDWRCVVEVQTWLRSHPRGDAVGERLIGPVWYGTDAAEAAWRFPRASREAMLAEKFHGDFVDSENQSDVPLCEHCHGPVFIDDYDICLACGRSRLDGKQSEGWRDDHFVVPKLVHYSRGSRVAWFRKLGRTLRESGFGAEVAQAAETYTEE